MSWHDFAYYYWIGCYISISIAILYKFCKFFLQGEDINIEFSILLSIALSYFTSWLGVFLYIRHILIKHGTPLWDFLEKVAEKKLYVIKSPKKKQKR